MGALHRLPCGFLFQEEENRLREELRQEWEAKQEKIKSERSWGGMPALLWVVP